MTSLVQSPYESVYSYVMRCITIRQKVMNTESNNKAENGFDKELILKELLQTLERDILNQYVLQEIKPLLRPALEQEKCNFQNKSKQSLKVYENDHDKTPSSVTNDCAIAKLLSAADKSTCKVSSLESELKHVKRKPDNSMSQRNGESRTVKCKSCISKNVSFCSNCYC